MKYWWLKRYKDIKIKLIPELSRQVNDNLVMPKNYKERYMVIKENDIEKLNEEDLLIYLYCILNHEKIKNNKIILIINELLKIPDNSMPATNYTLLEMLEDVKKKGEIYVGEGEDGNIHFIIHSNDSLMHRIERLLPFHIHLGYFLGLETKHLLFNMVTQHEGAPHAEEHRK